MASLTVSQTSQFTATVSGLSNTAVTWSLSPSVGTVSSTGLYTAPASITSSQTVTVKATSAADPTKSASASIALAPPVSVSVTPATASLTVSQTSQFTATVSGSSNTGVTWSLSPSVGTVSSTGLYTAPASISSTQTVTVKATSTADPTQSASASVALAPLVSVSLTPTTASLTASQIQQFTATVSGSSNTAVTWSVSPAVGTISSTGLYTSPGSIANAQSVTVKATSAADPTKSASVSVALAAPVSVSVTPSTASLTVSQASQFTATVSGSSNTAVTWSVSPAVGTISSTGLYTAPASIGSAQTATVKATSAADPTKSANASIALAAPVTISVSPATASLTPTQFQQLTAVVSGTTNTAVTWSLKPAVGTIATAGPTAVYNAPSIIDVSQTVEVDATSMADSTKIAKALFTLVPAVLISATPGSATLADGQTQQFTAQVIGTSNTAVTWSLDQAIGSISSTGLYTAPAILLADQSVGIKATSQADSSKSATVQIRLKAKPKLTFTLNNNGLDTLVWNGVNYNYKYGEGLFTSVNLRAADGSTSFTYGPPCTKSLSGAIVNQNCNVGSAQFQVVSSFSLSDTQTICSDVAITNSSPSATIDTATFSVLGFTSPTYDPATSKIVTVGRGQPAGLANFVAGRWALWIDNPSPDAGIGIVAGWQYIFKNQPTLANVGPGQTKSLRACMRLTSDMTSSLHDIAPEAYDNYRAAYPQVLSWPDRRPIMSWFVADYGKRSATNPRGYFQDASVDASNLGAFHDRAVQTAMQIRDQMNARPVKPQGIIVWDLEGQEFIQPTTYIGDPTAFASGYAPEMNAAADDTFAVFKNAGYRVGVTLRPQHLNWGTVLPTTCHYDPSNDYKDYFIKTNAPAGASFFACYDPAGVLWSLIPQGNGGQTFYHSTETQAVTQLLRGKIAYARNRWGATLFYVDSTVWVGGAPITADIFRQLEQEFPDVLFIPEEETMDTLSAGIPFTDPKNPSDPRFSPLTYRWVYPTGAMAIRLPDCTDSCWTNNVSSFTMGLKVGDIALYNSPNQMSPAQLGTIEALIQQVRHDNSFVYVTDSGTGKQFTFSGDVTSVLDYPVKLRVYFSDSAANVTGSSLYCEAGQWLGENTCTLNLQGMSMSQIRYYDFAGQMVKQLAPVPLQ